MLYLVGWLVGWALFALPDFMAMIRKRDEATNSQEDAVAEQKPHQAATEPMWKRMYIRTQDLEKYGYTKSHCDACAAILKGAGRAGIIHSEKCRTRIVDEMRKCPEGRQRLAEHDERELAFISSWVENSGHASSSSSSRKRPADS